MHRYLVDIPGKQKQKCAGPYELEEWIENGLIENTVQVCDVRTGEWRTASETLKQSKGRDSYHHIDECEKTLSCLQGVADDLKKMLEDAASKRSK